MNPIAKTTLFVLVLNLALASAGCGTKSGSPTSVVNKYHQAIMDKDLDTVLSLSAPDANTKMLRDMLDFRSDVLKKGGLPKVIGEKIDGDTAVVTYVLNVALGPNKQGIKQDVQLVKVNGEWKVKY